MNDTHIATTPTADEIEAMEHRMLAYVFPSTPHTQGEKDAFSLAVKYQIAHEKTMTERLGGQELPQGATSFAVGDFSMSFSGDGLSQMLTRRSICPAAYGVLLRAGLLYRGVEGR